MAQAVSLPAPPRMGFGRHLALASYWFGIYFHWTPILAVILPFQVHQLLPRSEQGSGIGAVTGLGAVFAVMLPPLVGFWSDRLHTRWGRRRPIMAVATVLNAAGLIVLMTAPSFPLLILGYLVVQIANNSAGAAFNGMVPDVVPAAEFGKASGVLGAMVQLGSIAGLLATLAVGALTGSPTGTYAVVAVVLLLSLLPTLWASEGEGMKPVAREPAKPARQAVSEFLRPLGAGDFGWVIYTRTMITSGVWCVLPFLQFFFGDVLRVRKADVFTAEWELILLIAATPFGLLGGWVSDRYGRKIFVYCSGALMGLVLTVFIVFFSAQTWLVLVLGAIFGVGYGLYFAVDWALACDTLPDRTKSAKDMGLFHVAFALPQVFLPALGGFVLDILNRQSPNSGYRAVFGSGIVFFILGTILVSRIRSVR